MQGVGEWLQSPSVYCRLTVADNLLFVYGAGMYSPCHKNTCVLNVSAAPFMVFHLYLVPYAVSGLLNPIFRQSLEYTYETVSPPRVTTKPLIHHPCAANLESTPAFS